MPRGRPKGSGQKQYVIALMEAIAYQTRQGGLAMSVEQYLEQVKKDAASRRKVSGQDYPEG